MKNRRQKPLTLRGNGRLVLPDGDLTYVPEFFSAPVGDRLFSNLFATVRWTQPRITISVGKWIHRGLQLGMVIGSLCTVIPV